MYCISNLKTVVDRRPDEQTYWLLVLNLRKFCEFSFISRSTAERLATFDKGERWGGEGKGVGASLSHTGIDGVERRRREDQPFLSPSPPPPSPHFPCSFFRVQELCITRCSPCFRVADFELWSSFFAETSSTQITSSSQN